MASLRSGRPALRLSRVATAFFKTARLTEQRKQQYKLEQRKQQYKLETNLDVLFGVEKINTTVRRQTKRQTKRQTESQRGTEVDQEDCPVHFSFAYFFLLSSAESEEDIFLVVLQNLESTKCLEIRGRKKIFSTHTSNSNEMPMI